MKKETLLSIIIPNYNKEKYLKRCLNSIVDQDLSNVEIIVLDDCSTDNSVFILKHYSKINLVTNSSNKGICITRNIGISLASGEYITFLDSDDYLTDDYIYNIKKVLKSQKDLYIFDVKKYKGNEIKREYICREQGLVSMKDYIQNNSQEYLKAHISYWVWNKIFKKSIIDHANLKFEAFDCEDEDFCSKYMLYPEFCSLSYKKTS